MSVGTVDAKGQEDPWEFIYIRTVLIQTNRTEFTCFDNVMCQNKQQPLQSLDQCVKISITSQNSSCIGNYKFTHVHCSLAE